MRKTASYHLILLIKNCLLLERSKRFTASVFPNKASRCRPLTESYLSFVASCALNQLLCIVENDIHILVKTDDVSFDPQRRLLIRPDLNPRLGLQVPEDPELINASVPFRRVFARR